MKGYIICLLLALGALPARAADLNTLIRQGDSCDCSLENHKALTLFLSAEKLSPGNPEVLRRVAREYAELMADTDSADEKRRLGQIALDYATRAVSADPGNAMTQLSVAICYGRLAPLMDNRTKIAYSQLVKQHVNVALSLDPKNDLTYNVLGAWNYELAGLNPVLRAVAGVIYGKVPDASYEDAVNDFRKAVDLNPGRLANHIGLGRALAAMDRNDEARKELELGLAMPNRDKDDPFEKERARETLRKIE